MFRRPHATRSRSVSASQADRAIATLTLMSPRSAPGHVRGRLRRACADRGTTFAGSLPGHAAEVARPGNAGLYFVACRTRPATLGGV